MGRVIRSDHQSISYRKKRVLNSRREEKIGHRFKGSLQSRKIEFTVIVENRPIKVFLIPVKKKSSRLGDTILIPERITFYGLLEEIEEETGPDGTDYLLRFDCMERGFTQGTLEQMLVQPDFPFDQIAIAARSCVIEFSLPEAVMRRIAAAASGRQRLAEATWWELDEINLPANGTSTVLATKLLPELGNTDPTTIANDPQEVVTTIAAMRVPEDPWLQRLIRLSHGSEELQKRYGQ